ncbi:MAG TPA: helix-turn-helix domain-containing protein [Candidatus Nitrosotenuis sp.]|nr:helix-turn-helix domain-containing protein [Candidatus Nitrosotenuis sp.]
MERLFRDIDYVSPFLFELSDFVGKRWNFRVLWELRNHKTMRYGELLVALNGISPSTLASVLRDLQNEGLIKRIAHGKSPPYRVEYKITKKGLELIIASSYLVKWAIKKKKR